jgi:hypothetical protein
VLLCSSTQQMGRLTESILRDVDAAARAMGLQIQVLMAGTSGGRGWPKGRLTRKWRQLRNLQCLASIVGRLETHETPLSWTSDWGGKTYCFLSVNRIGAAIDLRGASVAAGGQPEVRARRGPPLSATTRPKAAEVYKTKQAIVPRRARPCLFVGGSRPLFGRVLWSHNSAPHTGSVLLALPRGGGPPTQ